MVEIPREGLMPTYGSQYSFDNELKGYVSGTTDSGQPWVVSRVITSNIIGQSQDSISVELDVVERKRFANEVEAKTIGDVPFPFEDYSTTVKETYSDKIEVNRSDVEIYQADAQPKKYAQSSERWPFAGEAIIPNIKDWHESNGLRVDVSDID